MSAEITAALSLLKLRGAPVVRFAEPLTVEIREAPALAVEGPYIDCAGNRIPAAIVRTVFAR